MLCRAKSNAAFYYRPEVPALSKERETASVWQSCVSATPEVSDDIVVDDKTFSATDKVVRTRMCPVDVMIPVIRKRARDPSKPSTVFSCIGVWCSQLRVDDGPPTLQALMAD